MSTTTPALTARYVKFSACVSHNLTSAGSSKIIGQGGPTNEVFAALWGNIATQFAGNSKIIFGVFV